MRCRNDENPIPAWGAEVAARQRVAVLVDAIAEVLRYSLRVGGSGTGWLALDAGKAGVTVHVFSSSPFLRPLLLFAQIMQASEPVQQQISCPRDRLHGQQQGHQQIAADVKASRSHGMTN